MFSFLKEFFIDMPIDMIKDSPIMGSIMAFMMFIIVAILAIFIFALTYYILNNSFTKNEKETVVVVSKYFTPQHTVTTTQMMLVGKVLVPLTQTITYPDTWTLVVEKDYEQGNVNVSQSLYNEVEKNMMVEVMYHTGRLDKTFKPESVLGFVKQKVN